MQNLIKMFLRQSELLKFGPTSAKYIEDLEKKKNLKNPEMHPTGRSS